MPWRQQASNNKKHVDPDWEQYFYESVQVDASPSRNPECAWSAKVFERSRTRRLDAVSSTVANHTEAEHGGLN